MNIDNKRYKSPVKGFLGRIAPFATAATGGALGFFAGGLPGALTGAKIGYSLGSGDFEGGYRMAEPEISKAVNQTIATGGVLSNKRKR